MKTFMAKTEEIQRNWYVVDAADKSLGRIASKIAAYLRGKHKPIFTPHVDTGDFIIVKNADKIVLKGNNKLTEKFKTYYTGHRSGLRKISYTKLINEDPVFIIEHAVKGMLPKTKLGRKMFKKLKVYTGEKHPHQAQNPQELEL